MARLHLKTPIKGRGDLYRNRFNDIRAWREIGPEARGARAKAIYCPDNSDRRYLVKFPLYGDFEIQTETFNSILANELGMRHVQYFPISLNGKHGIACESFIKPSNKGEELWEMKELVLRHSSSAPRDAMGRDKRVLSEHQIENLFLILDSEFETKVLKKFFEMIGFDCLIGHGDRHWENYGFIIRMNDKELLADFAPIYDTASGYLTEIIDEEKLVEKLNTELVDPAWYDPQPCKKPLCKITVPNKPKCNHFDLLRYILGHANMAKFRSSIERPLQAFHPDLPSWIIRNFLPRLNPIRAKIIETILTERYKTFLSILKETK